MRRATLIAVAGTTLLIVLMDWVPTPLNRNILQTTWAERLPGTLIHAVTGAAVVAANLARRRWLIFAGAVWYSVVLVSAVLNWWVPYVLGLYPGEISLAAYVREYGGNLTLLPRIGTHPVVPDVQHTLIHLGVLLSATFSWLTFLRHPGCSASRGGSRSPGS